MSEDDQVDPGGMTEADAEVQIVTECWLEPQYGICCNNTPERQHFNGLTYMDIAKAVSTKFVFATLFFLLVWWLWEFAKSI